MTELRLNWAHDSHPTSSGVIQQSNLIPTKASTTLPFRSPLKYNIKMIGVERLSKHRDQIKGSKSENMHEPIYGTNKITWAEIKCCCLITWIWHSWDDDSPSDFKINMCTQPCQKYFLTRHLLWASHQNNGKTDQHESCWSNSFRCVFYYESVF